MSKYNEERSVEQPAIDLFQELNWETYNAYDEVLGEEGDLSRETTEEVVLAGVLREKLKRFNPDIPGEQIEEAVQELKRELTVTAKNI